MITYKTNGQKEMSLPKILCVIFIPSLILAIVYIFTGGLKLTIPSILLFYICAALILFPIEIGLVLYASKKEYGSFSLKSAFTNYNKMSWWKILIYGSLLFAFAGLMSVTVAPLENSLFASISNKLTQSIPLYFGWKNIEYLKQYPTDILLLTCVGYFVCNVIVGPIVEELYFRGYLTSKISRFGNFAPLIITILFLYIIFGFHSITYLEFQHFFLLH